MKKDLPERERDENDDFIEDFPTRIVDWREDPDDVLEAVDELIKPLGFEVSTYDTGGDCVEFAVHRLPEATYNGVHPANIAAIIREKGLGEDLALSVERLGRLAGVKFLGD